MQFKTKELKYEKESVISAIKHGLEIYESEKLGYSRKANFSMEIDNTGRHGSLLESLENLLYDSLKRDRAVVTANQLGFVRNFTNKLRKVYIKVDDEVRKISDCNLVEISRELDVQILKFRSLTIKVKSTYRGLEETTILIDNHLIKPEVVRLLPINNSLASNLLEVCDYESLLYKSFFYIKMDIPNAISEKMLFSLKSLKTPWINTWNAISKFHSDIRKSKKEEFHFSNILYGSKVLVQILEKLHTSVIVELLRSWIRNIGISRKNVYISILNASREKKYYISVFLAAIVKYFLEINFIGGFQWWCSSDYFVRSVIILCQYDSVSINKLVQTCDHTVLIKIISSSCCFKFTPKSMEKINKLKKFKLSNSRITESEEQLKGPPSLFILAREAVNTIYNMDYLVERGAPGGIIDRLEYKV